jgi:hypothetical protein
MSLFKERQASAKKVIQLQNEVLTLKMELSQRATPQPKDCEDCTNHKQKTLTLEEDLTATQTLIKILKADLKKSKREATRLKNKFSALQASQEKSEEDV